MLYCFFNGLNVNKSLFPLEPSAPPANVRGHNTSSTSVLVEWNDVPAADQNGIILCYTITYESQTENHNGKETVYYPTLQTELTGLNEYVNYSITVFASTVKGNGPTSSPIFVITDEDSKYSFYISNFTYCCGLNFLDQWRYCWLSSGSLPSDIQNRARQVSSRGENFSAKQNLPKGSVLGH